MANPAQGKTKPAAGVTATRPATMPEANPRAVGLPRCHHSIKSQLSPAAAAAAWVAAKADTARLLLFSALPPLKPNQPNHNKPAPVNVSTMLLGWMACSGYPRRLRNTRIAARLEKPAAM